MTRGTPRTSDNLARRTLLTVVAAAVAFASTSIAQATGFVPTHAQADSAQSNLAPTRVWPTAPGASSQPRRGGPPRPAASPDVEATQSLRPAPVFDQRESSPRTGLQWHEAIQSDCVKNDFVARSLPSNGAVFS